jgi:hypothetical protein
MVNSGAASQIQVSDTLLGGPPHLNPFGSDVIFTSYLDGEVEYEKTDPETGDLIGYGYLPIFRTELRLLSRPQNLQVNATQEEINTFREAFNEALRRLDDTDCAKFFSSFLSAGWYKRMGDYEDQGENARNALLSVEFRFLNLGAPRRDPNTGGISVIGASTNAGYNPSIFVNRQGPFFNQRLFVQGAGYRTFDLGSGLTGKNFRAFILLHELGHLIRKFLPDAQDSELNQRYSQQVLDECFKERRR